MPETTCQPSADKTLSNRIQTIIDRRLGRHAFAGQGHLDVINAHEAHLLKVKTLLENYAALRDNIQFQINNQKGEYHTMAVEDPSFSQAIEAATPEECLAAIDKALAELRLLKLRFGRETVNISVIGRARQGKSRLLQSISGLRDEVIPASNGGDCTGAKSVICNKPGVTSATVVFYSEVELVGNIQRYLDTLKIPVTLGSITQVPALVQYINDFKANLASKSGREQSLFGHLRKYVEHFNEYAPLLGSRTDVDENHIRDYVAQYGTDMKPTYKFLGVKEVKIYTEFNFADAGKIVLVDTIGLGDTSLGIREKMLATLREDSDAAILVRLPSANGDSIRVEDDELYDLISEAMGLDMLGKWLFFALNVGEGLQNFNSGDAMEEALKQRQLNFADIRKVDCADPVAVQTNLLLPLLEYLVDNLADVDSSLMAKANKALETCYMRYYELCAKANSVLKGGLKAALNSGGLFDELFDDRLGLKRELNKLNQKYNTPGIESPEIRDEVLKIVRGMGKSCPRLEEIKLRLTEGGPDSHVETAYNFYADNLRASMRDALDNVNNTVITGLQDDVKRRIIEVLRSDEGGRLARIPLMIDENASPFEWLAALIEQKCGDFPKVGAALADILNFRLNIEGLLEYKANIALRYLDQDAPEFTRLPGAVHGVAPDEKAEILLQTLMSAIPDVAQSLVAGISELLLIPNNSFNARIRKLRERLIFKQDGYRELKNFYREHAPALWADDFKSIVGKQAALDSWNQQLESLGAENRKERFIITL